MDDFVRMSTNHKYNTSSDYEHLFALMQETPVVCMVDYDERCRDIASTLFSGSMFSVSVRGMAYISAFSKEEFIRQCGELNLEFIDPYSSKQSRCEYGFSPEQCSLDCDNECPYLKGGEG